MICNSLYKCGITLLAHIVRLLVAKQYYVYPKIRVDSEGMVPILSSFASSIIVLRVEILLLFYHYQRSISVT